MSGILRIAERDGWACHYCGAALTVESATRDHIVPRSRRGSNQMHNLVLACAPCNHRKRSNTWHYDCDHCNRARAIEADRRTRPQSVPLAHRVAEAWPMERCNHLSAAAYCLNCAAP